MSNSNLTFSKLWDSACRVACVPSTLDSDHRRAAKNDLLLASMLDGDRVLIESDNQFAAVVKTVRKHAINERQSLTAAEAVLSAKSLSWSPEATSSASAGSKAFDPQPAKAGDKCVRCNAPTKIVLLAGGDRGAYCSIDKVVTPVA